MRYSVIGGAVKLHIVNALLISAQPRLAVGLLTEHQYLMCGLDHKFTSN
jgi:hypothetical protein